MRIAGGGAEPETIQSIKYNAPLDYASQGRAVTTEDYKVIIPKVFADTKAVQVWGGEDNNPPIYGQVFVSIKTISGINLTQAQKDVITTSLDKYNIASVRINALHWAGLQLCLPILFTLAHGIVVSIKRRSARYMMSY